MQLKLHNKVPRPSVSAKGCSMEPPWEQHFYYQFTTAHSREGVFSFLNLSESKYIAPFCLRNPTARDGSIILMSLIRGGR